MMETASVYALFNTKLKAFVYTGGYYGNEYNIMAFRTKEDGMAHIAMYYRGKPYTLKRMKVQA